MRRNYGISVADYEAKHRAQSGKCAICDEAETALGPTGRVRPLSVDHCHTSNKVRGLLCNNCNHAIGKFKDDPRVVDRAAEYLRFYEEVPDQP